MSLVMAIATDYIRSTDDELFVLLRQGDEQAFRTLYRRYDKRLFAYCLRVLGNRQGAEDAFQTIIMVMYEKRESFTGGNFAAWLFTIARTTSIKAVQRQSAASKSTAPIDNALESLQSLRTDDDVFLREAVQAAVTQLQEEYREPLQLRYFDGFSYEQIATIVGISVAAAKVRVFRAKKMLQPVLAAYMQELS